MKAFLSSLFILSSLPIFSQHLEFQSIDEIATTATTAAKPQSKVWKYLDRFYAVFPNREGTHVWMLQDNHWQHHLKLSERTNSQADCFAQGDTTFLLLFQGVQSEFLCIKFDAAQDQYRLLDGLENMSQIAFDQSTETATICYDSQSTLWMTYESDESILVRSAKGLEGSWSTPISICNNVHEDDICAIVTMSNSIGVLWSNQKKKQFGFSIHKDGEPINRWSEDEVPAIESALLIGDGMSDDHINMKYTADGTLYAAIKTSYDRPGYPKIGLLIRRPSGEWDDLYTVSNHGTRPIVVVDTSLNTLSVIYTSREAGGDIVKRDSPLDDILFSPEIKCMIGGGLNNVSSTKFPYDCDNMVIASTSEVLVGKLITCTNK